MATQTKQKSAGRKRQTTKTAAKNTKKKSAPVNATPEEIQKSKGLQMEIFVWIILLISVLLLIGNFGAGGAVGDMISSFFFGVMGWSAYLFPVYIFFTIAFTAVNRKNFLVWKKLAGLLLAFFCFTGLVHLFTVGVSSGEKVLGYYKYCSTQKTGGGILGGFIARVLTSGFGTLGAYVILLMLFLIAVILITQRSVLKPLKRQSEKVYRHNVEKHNQRKKERKNKSRRPVMIDFPFDMDFFKTDQEIKEKEKKEKNDRLMIDLKEPVENKRLDEDLFTDVILKDSPQKEPKTEEVKAEDKEPAPEKKNRKKNPYSSQEEIRQGIEDVQAVIDEKDSRLKSDYRFPPVSILKKGRKNANGDSEKVVKETASKLQNTLHNFGVNVRITNVSCGPTVTRYELQPEQGVKVSKIVGLTDDIKLNLAAADIRIEAPIPGKAAVGIEVPNKTNSTVALRDLIDSDEFKNFPSSLAFAVGKDIAGKIVVADIGKMPHLLIAGATGSGKSVCINTLIMSLLYKSSPEDVKLIMIDPKVVELSVYNGIPHLFIPVVTDPKKAAGALNWAVSEMTERYNLFAEYNVRDLKGYNRKVEELKDVEDDKKPKKLPKIVIIVDELADLMMVAPGEVEDSICRLAQLARAAGIHLIIATQRPSVNVITGLIKANMPSRIAFSVSSGVDSRTIIDMNGAEKLLGSGDMLYYPQGYQKPSRLQGAFVSDNEVSEVVEYLKKNYTGQTEYNEKITEMMSDAGSGNAGASDNELDVYFTDAGKCIIEKDKASIGMLQRVFKIGFNRAARIMDQLSRAGVVGPEEGTKPRKILMSMEDFEKYIEESV